MRGDRVLDRKRCNHQWVYFEWRRVCEKCTTLEEFFHFPHNVIANIRWHFVEKGTVSRKSIEKIKRSQRLCTVIGHTWEQRRFNFYENYQRCVICGVNRKEIEC